MNTTNIDEYDLADEDKHFIIWTEQNKLSIEGLPVDIIKLAYMSGFSYGYAYQRQYKVQEYLQK